ncbi:hypothetical protein ACSFBM_20110 [Variovorax sp. GB1R11]|uniref:hypothetical protein n=1 Tax=Variovorax sp. GB1R11 TaxID=3443741 RepID=UPI003F48F42F
MIGCASIGLDEQGLSAARLWHRLCRARLLGPPALDVAFNTADLPLMLRIGGVSPRYRQHFFGVAA